MAHHSLRSHRCGCHAIPGASLEGSGPGEITSAWDQSAKREQGDSKQSFGIKSRLLRITLTFEKVPACI